MRKGLLLLAAALLTVAPLSAQPSLLGSSLPSKDNLPTVIYGSDLPRWLGPLQGGGFVPLTLRGQGRGIGSIDAPRSYKGYGRIDGLIWWLRDQQAPLLFDGPKGLHVGGDGLQQDNQERMGLRATGGRWLNNVQTLAVEATVLKLGQRSPGVWLGPGFTPPGDSEVLVGGRVFNLSRLWSVELTGRAELCRFEGGHIDLLMGARHLQLDESVEVLARHLDETGVADRFGSHHQFWGGQVGLEGELNWGRWALDVWGKLGLGVNHQVIEIDGQRVLGDDAMGGGYLAGASNSGRYVSDPFALLPEGGFSVAYRMTDNVRVTAGYSILFMTQTQRPGEQIDASRSRPTFPALDTTFWAQGINVGVEWRW